MKLRSTIWLGTFCLGFGFGAGPLASPARAQYGTAKSPQVPQDVQQGKQGQQGQQTPDMAPPNGAVGQPPKTDPKEEAAYKAFHELKTTDTDKIVETGEQFALNYPNSRYTEVVYARLTQAYFAKSQGAQGDAQKQALGKMYDYCDKALSTNPDDVDVLSLVGWVIPHSYDANDMDAERRLTKAETYSKHAIDLLDNIQKPVGMTDEDFAKSKSSELAQSHSALGLVYFRRGQYAESVGELQKATQVATSPDPTDFYVMGLELQQIKRFDEAAQAYEKCSQIQSGLQPRCKQGMEQAKKMAASQPAPAKP